MAEALNISLEHLAKMEHGKRNPSIDLLVAMVYYFHVSTDYLLVGKNYDMVGCKAKLLDAVTQLTETVKKYVDSNLFFPKSILCHSPVTYRIW